MITEEELKEFERETGLKGVRVHYTDEEWDSLDSLKDMTFKTPDAKPGKQIRFCKYNSGNEGGG